MSKKVNVLIVIFLCGIGHVNAQPVQWGISASSSFHELDFDDPLPWWESSGLTFPAIGVSMEWPMQFIEGPLGNILWLKSGIRLVRLATKVDFELELGEDNQLFTGAFRIRQYYASIPVQFRLDLGQAPVYVLVGPEFGVLLTANRTSETFTPVASRASSTQQIGGELRRINISIYGGIGVHIYKGIDLFGQYGRGVNQVLKPGEQTISDSDWSTRELEIGLKVDFGR